jgi:co-chaperonin GroES (HSP10)
LKALNDIYIIEEDPIDWEVDAASGLTPEVMDMLKSGKLVLPDQGDYFAKKFPCTGKVLAKGDKSRYEEASVGSRVAFARLGGQRWKTSGKSYVSIREKDLHCVLN